MKKFLPFLSLLLILFFTFFTSTGNAGLRDRLQPIVEGELNIAVDTFIIGTHDRYIAIIVRDFDPEATRDMSAMTADMLAGFGNDNLVIVERRIFDKTAKRLSLIERRFVLRDDLQASITSESFGYQDLEEAAPGSIEELMWYGVAGEDGWGIKILGGRPEPAELTFERTPLDSERYIIVVRRDFGGVFIDRDSIKITEEGVSALVVEGFNFDAEFQYGIMAMQNTYQPYVDAHYAITGNEFSFEKRAYRQLRFTMFGPENQVIYAVRMAAPEWIGERVNPLTPYLLFALARHLPEDIPEHLSDGVKSFLEYMWERVGAIQRELRELEQQEPHDLETEEELTESP